MGEDTNVVDKRYNQGHLIVIGDPDRIP